jgi:outer membrane protein, heavy metal efflux system
MRARSPLGPRLGLMLMWLGLPVLAGAQTTVNTAPPATRVSMADAVRLALEHNHQLLAQRLNIDTSKADEVTAALKPNPVFTSTNQNFPLFTPSQLSWNNFTTNQTFTESLSYLIERGGKREKRTVVARDTTEVAGRTAADAERQLVFQTRQAFINVLLAKSTLDLGRQDLKDFTNIVDINRQRMKLGDLAEGDFYKISLQQLQFEQDVAAAELALAQSLATLRQAVGFEEIGRAHV